MRSKISINPPFTLAKAHAYLSQFDSKEFDQDYAINRLIWYLNSGGRRSFVVVDRPDNTERNLPRADYVCEDKITGGHVTVEVTKIFHDSQVRGIEKFREMLWHEIAAHVDGQLPGTFIPGLPASIKINQRQRPSIISEIAKDMIAVAASMKCFQIQSIRHGFSLFKLSDDGTYLGPPSVQDSSNDPTVMMDWQQLVEAIATPLSEANQKLSAYALGIRVLLLDCQFFLDAVDVDEAMCQINRENFPTIDRLYLLNVEHRQQLKRAW